MIEVSVSTSGKMPSVELVRRIVMDEAGQAMRDAMNIVLGEAQKRAPYRTGTLRRSLNAHTTRTGLDTVAGTVGTDLFYAVYLDRGTGLYGPRHRWITPIHAKALRFPSGGVASLFRGGQRVAGETGPGFTRAGRVRSGSAGAAAAFVFARRVRGIRPRFFMEDAAAITRGRTEMAFRLHGISAARRIERAVRSGK